MTRIILDETLGAKLAKLSEHAELCDTSGRTLGHFLPPELYCRLIYDWANAQITDDELQRRLRETGGRTLKDIWNDLECS